MVGDVWSRVVGQDRAVALLQRAAGAARRTRTCSSARAAPASTKRRGASRRRSSRPTTTARGDLALRGAHPDVVEIDPADNQIRVEDAQEIIDEAYSSPIEGARKVIIVFEAERLRFNDRAANKLLKTLEEPPPTALLVLVTAGPDQLLPTIRSRCQRVDFAFLNHRLRGHSARRRRASTPSGPSCSRASPVAASTGRVHSTVGWRRSATRSWPPPRRLDGTGGAVISQSEFLQESMKAAVAELEAAHAEETADLEAELEEAGYPDRTRRAQLRRLAEQHKRVHRHARTEVLIEGITALETVYRDALAGADVPALNVDRSALALDARACGRALDACREARQALIEHNPNETLLLERLLLHLPAASRRA